MRVPSAAPIAQLESMASAWSLSEVRTATWRRFVCFKSAQHLSMLAQLSAALADMMRSQSGVAHLANSDPLSCLCGCSAQVYACAQQRILVVARPRHCTSYRIRIMTTRSIIDMMGVQVLPDNLQAEAMLFLGATLTVLGVSASLVFLSCAPRPIYCKSFRIRRSAD